MAGNKLRRGVDRKVKKSLMLKNSFSWFKFNKMASEFAFPIQILWALTFPYKMYSSMHKLF